MYIDLDYIYGPLSQNNGSIFNIRIARKVSIMLKNMQIDDRGADRSHFQDNVKVILKAERACLLADEESVAARQEQAGPAGDRIRTCEKFVQVGSLSLLLTLYYFVTLKCTNV